MKNSRIRVLLIGAAGRMGKTINALADGDPNLDIAARCDLGDSIEPPMKNCDVAIDFSQAEPPLKSVALPSSTVSHWSLERPVTLTSNAESLKRLRGQCRSCLHPISASESMYSSG